MSDTGRVVDDEQTLRFDPEVEEVVEWADQPERPLDAPEADWLEGHTDITDADPLAGDDEHPHPTV